MMSAPNGQRKKQVPEGFKVLKEGDVEILQHGNDVFYNKTQIVNRDLSIAILRTFVEKRREEDAAAKANKKKRGGEGQGGGGKGKNKQAGQHASGAGSSAAPGAIGGSVSDGPGGVGNGPVASASGAPGAGESGHAGKVEERRGESGPEPGPSDDAAGSGPSHNEKGAVQGASGSTETANGDGGASSSGAAHGRGKGLAPLKVLEPLAASGLRSLRYAIEVDGLGAVLASDIDKVAVEACRRNIEWNGGRAALVQVREQDARLLCLQHEKAFDIVDLDPYGSPSIFLDSAVQSVADGGLFLCTATDMAVLCGNNGEVCYSKYGAYPLRAKYCHEMALRILLQCIESHANRYKRYIVPVLSLSVDFYIRVFVRIHTSPNIVKASPSKLSYVYQCVGCDSFYLQPLGRVTQKNNQSRYTPGVGPAVGQACENCGKHFLMGGPIWSEPIHDPAWVAATLSRVRSMKHRYPAYDKVHSILTAVSEELPDCPLYVSLHALSATLKCTPPSAILFRSAVANAGYRVSTSHANPLGIKTDAPMEVLWDIMRCWVKDHPVKPQKDETPGQKILAQQPQIQANFARSNAAQSKAQATRVPRFLPNPEQHWGPKPKAGRKIGPQHASLMGEAAVNGGPSSSNSIPAPIVGSVVAESTGIAEIDGGDEEPPAAKRPKLEAKAEAVGDS
ncbi:tRNA methyltransferase [Klebsormidium nitens]|uniref:tRNA (guanine(26)-N(2))-dimethyltransferase n=1 Tax=Klebsormidium nitens TaxID=105231 RepID=A0A1Y1HZX9_KLENI|nr:tRNA methyltransferase [Klebsormidium nitens]|eukprot:GAQ82087.1 tRNA methyltransferase [Klebsormidium nitens]